MMPQNEVANKVDIDHDAHSWPQAFHRVGRVSQFWRRPEDNPRAVAVFSGGCFWGVDAVFKHVKGVSKVVSGYAGGAEDTANYETVSTGTTGHAESVQVTYEPSKVSYDDLLKVFFSSLTIRPS